MTTGTSAWTALDDTSRSVALEVLRHGPLSRSELARRLGLSPGSLTRLTRPMLDRGVLVEDDTMRAAALGRPVRPLDVVADGHRFVGVRLTRTAATAVLTDLRARQLDVVDAPLPDLAPEAVVAVVAGLVQRLAPDGGVSATGVGLGGQVQDASVVLRAPFLQWGQVPLAELLTRATGVATCVENDLVALTTAEHWFGAAAGRDHFAVVTVGAGIGQGLVVGGRVLSGPEAGVGLLAHALLGVPGPLCSRGHQGCAEVSLTDGSLLAAAATALQRPVTSQELHDLAREGGHPAVERLLEGVAVALGRLVALVANTTLSPLVLVSGEGVDLALLVEDRVRAEVLAHRDPAAAELEVQFLRCPPEVWAGGAAALAVQAYVSGSMGTGVVTG